jgi:hypothetical protein
MSAEHPPLTAELIDQICGYIAGGAFDQTACESVGVPLEVFQGWLSQAQRKNASTLLRLLHSKVRQARAKARLKLEMDMRVTNPKYWLLHGPGKATPGLPGWSAPTRATVAASTEDEGQSKLLDFIAAMLDVLKPFPEAHAALEALVARYFPVAGTVARDSNG